MKHETDDDREYTSEEVGDAMVDSYDAGAKAEREMIVDWLRSKVEEGRAAAVAEFADDSDTLNMVLVGLDALEAAAQAVEEQSHSPDGSSSGHA